MQLRTPSLKPHIVWHRVGDDQVVICTRDGEKLVSSRLYANVLEAIDGSTTDEIVERLMPEFAPEETLLALHSLRIADYLEEAPAAPGAASQTPPARGSRRLVECGW
jgi:hypothetical protein